MNSVVALPIFTPIESEEHRFLQYSTKYLSPLFNNREIAVHQHDELCKLETRENDWTTTAIKVASYILSAGILPLLAILTTFVFRCIYDFHTVEEIAPSQNQMPKSPTSAQTSPISSPKPQGALSLSSTTTTTTTTARTTTAPVLPASSPELQDAALKIVWQRKYHGTIQFNCSDQTDLLATLPGKDAPVAEIREWISANTSVFTKIQKKYRFTELDLSNLGLQEIPDEIKALGNFKTLILNGNPLILTATTFEGFGSKLDSISLNNCALKATPSEVFAPLKNQLKNLNLDNNELTNLGDDPLDLPLLEMISIVNNPIKFLNYNYFTLMSKLQSIRLDLSAKKIDLYLFFDPPHGLGFRIDSMFNAENEIRNYVREIAS